MIRGGRWRYSDLTSCYLFAGISLIFRRMCSRFIVSECGRVAAKGNPRATGGDWKQPECSGSLDLQPDY